MNRDQAELMIGTGQTQRFHTELTLRSQDVGQHCYGVFWLCYALTAGEMSNALMLAAMSHDAGERWTGDLPGPTKLRMNLTAQFDAEEDRELMTRVGFPRPVLKPTERAVLAYTDALVQSFGARRAQAGGRVRWGVLLSAGVADGERHRPDDDGELSFLRARGAGLAVSCRWGSGVRARQRTHEIS